MLAVSTLVPLVVDIKCTAQSHGVAAASLLNFNLGRIEGRDRKGNVYSVIY